MFSKVDFTLKTIWFEFLWIQNDGTKNKVIDLPLYILAIEPIAGHKALLPIFLK